MMGLLLCQTRTRALVTAVVIVFAAGLALVPAWRAPGTAMDEGALLVYPGQVLAGAVPHRDFETFYGPGNAWLLAGAYEVFGTSVETERAVGLVERLVMVSLVFALALNWGIVAASACAALAAAILPATFLDAGVNNAVLILSLIALGAAIRGVQERDASRARRWFLVAGLAVGITAFFRPDFAPAALISVASLVMLAGTRPAGWTFVGLLIGLSPALAHVLVVGPLALKKVIVDLIESGPARRLPVPPLASVTGVRFLALLAATAAFLAVGTALTQRRRDADGRFVLAIGLFAVALMPYALSRLDDPHIITAGLVPVVLLPVLWTIVAENARRQRLAATGAAIIAIAGGALSLATILVRSHGQALTGYRSFMVEHEGRRFFFESQGIARGMEAVTSEASRLASPGDSLFVGPRDLRRTRYNETVLYYLLPSLPPASFYLELSPQTASRHESGLAEDVAGADFLILSRRLDRLLEGNDSGRLGSPKPNAVVERRFCARKQQDGFTLYQRCR